MEKPYVVGIDIGGQTAKLGIVNARGEILSRAVIASNQHTDATPFIKTLCKSIDQLIADSHIRRDEIRGIGVGAPNGNYYTGTIECAVNLTWGGNRPIRFTEILTRETGLPSVITNDANAAAMGEMHYGSARGMKNFIMITLGTGVGSGIVVDGKILYGHDGFAGELGHITAVRNNGRPCGCGKAGCLETYASAIGVARTAREMVANTTQPTLLREIPVEKITSKDVSEAAQKGDNIAKEIFNFTGKMLGESFADFVAFSAPEAIVLFGGLSKAGDLLLQPIIEHMEKNLLPMWQKKVKICFSQLKESDAAILGAGALAWEL